MLSRILFLVVFCLYSTAYANKVEVDIVLNPVGDFTATTNQLSGFATVKDGQIIAENIKVNLKSLKTGIKLRDEHTLKYLGVKKHPEAVLIKATGRDGKGQGQLQVNGKIQDVEGTYTVKGKELHAEFKVLLSGFGIQDISYKGVGVDDEATIRVKVPVK